MTRFNSAIRVSWIAGAAFSAALLAGGMAHADDDAVDCKNATTQTDMTACAAQDYDEADAQMNAQYKKTRAALQSTDDNLDDDQKGAVKALLAGQRAWNDYRDGECEAEGFQARGGSMEPMLVASCKANLTRRRVKELEQLAENIGN